MTFEVKLHIHPRNKIRAWYEDKFLCELAHVRNEERDDRQVMFFDPHLRGIILGCGQKVSFFLADNICLWYQQLALSDLDIDEVSVKSICYVWTPEAMAAISNKTLSKEMCAGGWICFRLSMKWAR